MAETQVGEVWQVTRFPYGRGTRTITQSLSPGGHISEWLWKCSLCEDDASDDEELGSRRQAHLGLSAHVKEFHT